MITIEIVRDSEQNIVEFHAKGHSGSAKRGRDIICAGVSALTQSALLGISQHLQRNIRWQAEDGLLSMKLCDRPDSQTGAVLETMLLGLKEIAKIQPEYVRIVENRR